MNRLPYWNKTERYLRKSEKGEFEATISEASSRFRHSSERKSILMEGRFYPAGNVVVIAARVDGEEGRITKICR